MRDSGCGVARVHGHARNVPSYKEGKHLHRPYHFPNPLPVASSYSPPPVSSRSPPLPPPHRVALPHRILFLTFITSICKKADARGDAGAAAGDLVELQCPGGVIADVGGVHGGVGKLATAADVAGSASSLQEVKVSSGAVNPDALVAPRAMEEQEDDGWGRKRKLADYDPYEGPFSDDSAYEYDSGDDVYKGNVASFIAKEVQKIKAKGVASLCRKFKKWHCPYCTTKP
ncbi:hypothetical protein D1007_11908 [Hordeum vulgare]|nr:hypothetical protein D1007_11908 [Hordeum vulgare]